MNALTLYAILIAAGFAAGSGSGFWLSHTLDAAQISEANRKAEQSRHEREQADTEARAVLAEETAKTLTQEAKARDFQQQLEKSRENHAQTANALSARLNQYRLYNAAANAKDGDCAVSGATSAELLNYAQATAEFSERLDRLVKTKAASADAIDLDFQLAQQWAASLNRDSPTQEAQHDQ